MTFNVHGLLAEQELKVFEMELLIIICNQLLKLKRWTLRSRS